jgi:hypothetical protein
MSNAPFSLEQVDPSGEIREAAWKRAWFPQSTISRDGPAFLHEFPALLAELAERGFLKQPSEPTLAELRERLRSMFSHVNERDFQRGVFVPFERIENELLQPKKSNVVYNPGTWFVYPANATKEHQLTYLTVPSPYPDHYAEIRAVHKNSTHVSDFSERDLWNTRLATSEEITAAGG